MSESDRSVWPTVDRRRFLVLGGSTCALLAAGLAGCDGGANGNEMAAGQFPVGQVSDFPVGSVTRFDEGPFFVLRDDAGLWAMTAVCPHKQCVVDPGADTLQCPCHGSAFDLDGAVVQGPASSPLNNLLVVVEDDETVIVDTTQLVPAGTRTPVA
jgi:cytochrome b6-f complex iron-sulfur subunit